MKNGKQYEVIGQFNKKDWAAFIRLDSMCQKQQKQLIQMDNIISIEEQSKPPQLYHNNRYLSATVSGLAPGKV
jgi:multidrug efflux pump subunit AcrB